MKLAWYPGRRVMASGAQLQGPFLFPEPRGSRPEEWTQTVTFHSILFDGVDDSGASEVTEPPEYFADLHLDDIVTSITAGRETRAVRPFFYAPLHDVGTIAYRQEVFRDLEEEASRGIVRGFAAKMQVVRTRLDGSRALFYRGHALNAVALTEPPPPSEIKGRPKATAGEKPLPSKTRPKKTWRPNCARLRNKTS